MAKFSSSRTIRLTSAIRNELTRLCCPTSVPDSAIAALCVSGGETQLLRIAVDAMHTCGLAMAVQALATALLGAPCK